MTDNIIPDDIKQFILQYIDSIAQCEGLLIFRASGNTPVSAEELAAQLYISPAEASGIIERFIAAGFLKAVPSTASLPQPQYIYAPEAGLDELVARTADLYKQYLIPVTHLIHSKPKSRIQEFADAFRLRKDK